MDMKEKVGQAIAERVESGQIIGVGTGSTVDAALRAIAHRVKNDGLKVQVVTSSLQSSWQCESIGLTVLYPGYRGGIDWGFDGADALDKSRRAIKGKGGALLQEKILAVRCGSFVIIADDTKVTDNIANLSYVPIEVIPEALEYVVGKVKGLGARELGVRQAKAKHGPVITEAGNVLVDAYFDSIADTLEDRLNCIVGVVENGLFLTQASEALIAGASGVYGF
jgi:ribose 5-phosphate isomerase A